MKFNRREIIRVADIKPAVQNMIRKTFGEHYLRQIRCVFPKAYHYTWDKILDRLGRHTSGDYELQMSPNMNYNEPDDTSSSDNERVKGNIQSKMSPQDLIGREKIALIFTNQLRQKLGVMFGDPWTTSGGKALAFHSSVRLRLKQMGQI